MVRIGIVNYTVGNIRSVKNALEFFGAQVDIVEDEEALSRCDKIVLPGVGAFKAAMDFLHEKNMLDTLKYDIIEKKRPALCICLGMQILADKGYEWGEYDGLGVVKGKTIKFDVDLKIPHIGWNTVKILKKNDYLRNVPDEAEFYFVHSFIVEVDEKEVVAGVSDYGREFNAILLKDNVIATQFHPEKSGPIGLNIIENFVRD